MAERRAVTITYLRQSQRPRRPVPAAPAKGAALLRAVRPPTHFYRYLYRLIGDPHNWVSRRLLSDGEIEAIIHDDDVHIYVLYIDGSPGGFCEFDNRSRNDIEIKFFGLAPERIGQGWGGFFLGHCLDLAWSLAPESVMLETCTLDHPAALPMYQRFGFEPFDVRTGEVELLAD